MMITRHDIKNYFYYNWWRFLIIAIFMIMVWSVAINELIEPNENEKIVLTIVNVDLDKTLLKNESEAYLKDYPNQNIQAVEIEAIKLGGIEFQEFLSTRALPGIDLIILPKSSILNTTASDLFLPLDEPFMIDFFGENVTYYFEGDTLYGISLTNCSYQNIFSSYLTEVKDEEYYVFINVHSHNIGDLNETSKTNEEAALELILWLLSEK